MEAQFPKTACSLWDKSNTGPATFLHLSYYRKPKVCVPEKVLKLIQHQCENYGQTTYVLVGSLVVEEDGEGIQFQVNHLDTRKEIPPDGAASAPGDILVPLDVTNNKAKERCGSVEDYAVAMKRLQERCCCKSNIDLSSFMLLRGWGSFYSNAVTSVAHLDFDMVTMETVFKATPINPVPIVLTALSKNLAGPMSLSHMQGTPKTGFLTMDHTRKLLLVLESDPKTATLPIVGIWVSGTEYVQHPYVWAACLRYIHSTHLEDRVCMPPSEFLLVLYTPLHSKPEFFQCCTSSGNVNFEFQLYTGHDVGNLTKSLSSHSDNFTEVELDVVGAGGKMEMFDAARAKHGLLQSSLLHGENDSHSVPEDIEPRAAPTPHMDKVPSFKPMVPDVSILWTEPSETPHIPPSSLPSRPYLPSSLSSASPQVYGNHSTEHFHQMYSNAGSYAPQRQPQLYAPQRQPQPQIAQASNMAPFMSTLARTQGNVYSQHREIPHSAQTTIPQRHQSPWNLQYQGHIGYPQPHGIGHNVHFPSQQLATCNTSHSIPSQLASNAPQFSEAPRHASLKNPYVMQSVPMTSGPRSYPAYTRPPSQPQPSSSLQTQQAATPMQVGHSAHASVGMNVGRIATNGPVPPMSLSQHAGILKAPTGHFHSQPAPPVQRAPVTAQAQIVNNNYAMTQNMNNNAVTQNVNNNAVLQHQRPGQTANMIFTPAPVQHENPPSGPTVLATSSLPSGRGNSIDLSHAHFSVNSKAPQPMSKDMRAPMTLLKTVIEESSSSSSSSATSKADRDVASSKNLRERRAEVHDGSHSNSTGSSSRVSDEDSGLSITPDMLIPSPQSQAQPLPTSMAPTSSTPGASAASTAATPVTSTQLQPPQASTSLEASMNSLNWNQVPPEIRMLLIQQNEQLKLLQQQIALLMQNQSQQLSASQSSANNQPYDSSATHVSANTSGATQISKQCSVGINTSFVDSAGNVHDTSTPHNRRNVQTSPQKFCTHPDFVASPVLMDSPSQQEQLNGSRSNGNTPAEIRNHGSIPVNSTKYEDLKANRSENSAPGQEVSSARTLSSQTSSSEEEETDHRDLVSAAESIPVYDHTINTAVSDLVVDMPDYASTEDSKSQSQFDRSPTSVSDYFNNGQDDSYSTLAEDATDPKQYYSQLMNNIQMFLTSDGSRDTEASENGPQSDTTVQSSPFKASASNNSTFVPQINYISMLLGCGSDAGQSMEINAMAMKYLNDEQLTQMAKLRLGCPKASQHHNYTEKILQKVIGHNKSSVSTPDASGISPNDMTMGTRKYLEKHGLLGGDDDKFISGSKEPSFFNHSMRLNTDFSMAASGGDPDLDVNASKWQSSNDGDVSSRHSQQSSPVKSPVRKEILRPRSNRPHCSPSTEEEDSPARKDRWLPDSIKSSAPLKDIGASPILPTSRNYNPNECNKENAMKKDGRGKSTKPKASKESPRRSVESATTTSAEDPEEENLLDIEKLKQLPKLL